MNGKNPSVKSIVALLQSDKFGDSFKSYFYFSPKDPPPLTRDIYNALRNSLNKNKTKTDLSEHNEREKPQKNPQKLVRNALKSAILKTCCKECENNKEK